MEIRKLSNTPEQETREIMPEYHTSQSDEAVTGAARAARKTARPKSRREVMEDPLAIFPRLASKFKSSWLAWTYPFASFGKNVWIHYSCQLSRSIASHIKVGDGVLVAQDVWFNIPPVPDRSDPAIILGDGCGVGRRTVISAKNRIDIGPNTILGPAALIMDHNHSFDDVTVPIARQGMTPGGTIRIEEGCWIGFGAAIVCNQGELVLGRNSVVAANALVTKSFPPYSVVVGNPGRLGKQFDPAKGVWVGGSSRPTDRGTT